jgi:hypothetical protein
VVVKNRYLALLLMAASGCGNDKAKGAAGQPLGNQPAEGQGILGRALSKAVGEIPTPYWQLMRHVELFFEERGDMWASYRKELDTSGVREVAVAHVSVVAWMVDKTWPARLLDGENWRGHIVGVPSPQWDEHRRWQEEEVPFMMVFARKLGPDSTAIVSVETIGVDGDGQPRLVVVTGRLKWNGATWVCTEDVRVH